MPITRRSLNFDFVRDGSLGGQGFLDPLFTFARASTATRFNSAGVLETVAADVPRFNFDPATQLCRGLLIEESRTNLVGSSADFGAGAAGSGFTVTNNYGVAPDGSTSAARLENAIAAYRYKTGAIVIGQTYTTSLWVKRLGGAAQVNIYDINGAQVGPFNIDGTWRRISATGVATTTTGYNGPVANAAVDILAWGAQIEAGAFATSYIPTTAAAVTRAAESCYTNSVSPWASRSSTFTLVAEYDLPAALGDFTILSVLNTTSGPSYLLLESGGYLYNRFPSATEHSTGLASAAGGHKAALSCDPDGVFKYFRNGTAGTGRTDSAKQLLSNLCLGSYNLGSSYWLNGHIARLAYLPFVVDDLSLQQMTVA